MDRYYSEGYTPPEGITDNSGVRQMQEQLNGMGANLAVDGVWGAETQSAYEQYEPTIEVEATPQFPDEEFQSIYDSIYSAYDSDSELKANIESALRPQYDTAIANLDEQRKANNAAIDVDAASRGMGTSTWVTDAKLQQLKSQSGQVASIESDYAAQLYANLLAQQGERDDEAYQRAQDFYNLAQSKRRGGNNPAGGVRTGYDLNGDGITDVYWTKEEYEEYLSDKGRLPNEVVASSGRRDTGIGVGISVATNR